MKDSAYNLCAQDTNGNYCLFNTRRGTAHILAAGAYKAYWAAANGASGLADATETLRDLIDKGFLVGNDVDELSEIMSAHEKARRSATGSSCSLRRRWPAISIASTALS